LAVQVYYDILLEHAGIDWNHPVRFTWEQFIVELQLTIPSYLILFVR
jgi:hypothetical protein